MGPKPPRKNKPTIVMGKVSGSGKSSRSYSPRSAQKAMEKDQFARDLTRTMFGSSNAFGRGKADNFKDGGKVAYKAMGGVAKYYEKGGAVLTGRQHNLPDHLKKKIIESKKKNMK
tara:strand:+ start:780 stop:1124 length:345 start_codon:yes stop_codon:yes gene_type:complete